ncbi:alpha-ketoglutarate-dependent dioxygenase alkB homolog 4 [Palaemon carinicauda]|uniref:alpha-ketoglutarate-dependent dioxygenase alkB homolog 4 n=1 Tax=Palaemon carinicauda TaxID=392227 RepID=UPI0035B58A36
MFHPRPCGCKGQRTCLVCEKEFGALNLTDSWLSEDNKRNSYVFCPLCELAWPGWEGDSWKVHPNHEGESIKFTGAKVILNLLSEAEEKTLMTQIDEVPWDLSQSGRKKQNYGPKCNFKKRRVRVENFSGYPAFTKFIQDRFSSVDILKRFQTVEQCSLDYSVERGASIDPHIDDCWIWGERIPTLSMLSDSVLTLRKFVGAEKKYNLMERKHYPSVMTVQGTVKEDSEIIESFKGDFQNVDAEIASNNGIQESPLNSQMIIRLPMPRYSLLILFGPARYEWEHGILRQDIIDRRVCITYRELTPTYLPFGPQSEIGRQILEASKQFWDHRKFYNLDISDGM